jgi:hypothetical protein
MLYKPPHRIMICELTKTETRRPYTAKRRPAKPGATRGFYTRPPFCKNPGKPFCRALILSCDYERLGAITEASARAEGYESTAAFADIWESIWGPETWRRDEDNRVWVVKFRLVEQLKCAGCGIESEFGCFEVKGHIASYCIRCSEHLEALGA